MDVSSQLSGLSATAIGATAGIKAPRCRSHLPVRLKENLPPPPQLSTLTGTAGASDKGPGLLTLPELLNFDCMADSSDR